MGIRLVVVDDNPHLTWEGRTYPVNATFHRFLAAVLDVPGAPVSQIVHCVPLRPADREPATLRLDPRLDVVGTVPFDGIEGFLRHAREISRRNASILGAAIRGADLAWLKVPASNAALAASLARRAGVPRFVWVAGKALGVVRGQRRGRASTLAALAAAAGYDTTGRIVGIGGDRLVVGDHLIDGSGIVATLVEPDELRDITTRASPFPRLAWRPRLAWAGRLAAGKGLETLVDGLARLAEADGDRRRVELVLIGDGPLRSLLEAHARQREVADRIHWLGYVGERSAYMDALDACDLFVFPSPAEGFPKVVLDAMALGLPVLASPSGALAELSRAGVVRAVAPGDPAALARGIDRLLGDATAAAGLRVAGRAFAEAHTRPAEARRLVERWRRRWPALPWDRS
jgi:glycosyltransferase involved in cell wall biosynthesis